MKFILCLLLFATSVAQAQPYVSGGNTRHRFAQMTLGSETRHHLANGSDIGSQTITYFTIGGTHFWGHTDFYVTIPLAAFGSAGYDTGTETGMKLFPKRIEDKKVRPYAGLAWHPASLQRGDGAIKHTHMYPLSAGLVYLNGMHMVDAGVSWNTANSNAYPTSRNTVTTLRTPPLSINLTYKVMLETTLSAERQWMSGETELYTDRLAERGLLDGFTMAIGPSTSMLLRSSEFTRNEAPYLTQHKVVNVFPDMAIGYYFHNPDIQTGLAYRNTVSELDAYGTSQRIQRNALTLEATKFLFDYHGFAAFVGPAISYERLSARHDTETATFSGIKPGLTFGWDIRPNRIQSWTLRTNLRWFPNLDVTMANGETIPLDQLEFNFIQLVIFPGRMF